MKFILVILVALLPASAFTQYVFNFSSGKVALWSNPINWEGGVVPPAEVGKITIVPPDGNAGWECKLDVDGISCYDTLRIKSNAAFTITEGVTLRSFKNIAVEQGAGFNVYGNCNLFCDRPGTNVIDNYGTMTVTGNIQNDPDALCLGFGFYGFNSVGPLYVHGSIDLRLVQLSASDFLFVSGSISSGYRGTVSASHLVNTGIISGNLTLAVHDLENNGQIHLAGNDFFNAGFFLNGTAFNYAKIHVEGEMSLTGSLINKGVIETDNVTRLILDSVDIVNDSSIYFGGETSADLPSGQSTLVNNGKFTFLSASNSPFVSNINLVNHGEMTVIDWDMLKGSVINYKTITFTTSIYSSYIRVPFINFGVVNTIGPVDISNAFINSGVLNTE